MFEATTAKLRTLGFRMTPQRLAILRILHDADRHLSPLEVCEKARLALPGLTEPTVYRTLNFLCEQGLVLAAHIGNGQLVYEFGAHIHHHLICRACGATHEIDHTLLAALYQQFQHSTGYQIDSAHVTFFGLCPGCQEPTS